MNDKIYYPCNNCMVILCDKNCNELNEWLCLAEKTLKEKRRRSELKMLYEKLEKSKSASELNETIIDLVDALNMAIGDICSDNKIYYDEAYKIDWNEM